MKENEIEFRNSINKELKEMFFDKNNNLTISGGIFLTILGITLAQQCLKMLGEIKNANID